MRRLEESIGRTPPELDSRPPIHRRAPVSVPLEPTGDAAEAWHETGEELLRGLAHQLSNRVGTVAALAEALAATDPANRLAGALADEAAQLEELLRLYRLLPRDGGRGAEPVRLQDVVRDALALFAHHPRGRGLVAPAPDVHDVHDVVPEVAVVRAHVPSVQRALLILLDAAAPHDADGPATVTVACRAEGERAVVRVSGAGLAAGPSIAARARRAAAALVAADGGAVTAEDGGLRLDLPALASRRRTAPDD